VELTLVLAGLAILVISTVFLVYGIFTENNVVTGVALSAIVVGVVGTVAGVTYAEPAEEFLNSYANDVNAFSIRMLEDMGIVDKHNIKFCLDEKLLIFSRERMNCGNAHFGIGISEKSPYIAFKLDNLFNAIANIVEGSESLASKLEKVLRNTIKMCRHVSINEKSDLVSIELTGLTSSGRALLSIPISIAKASILVVAAMHFGKSVEVVEEVLSWDKYTITILYGGEAL